ncbi:MAG: hypothetical protein A2033_12880 [Bacteroidetes bacterium GWA2_31_9]|nr:MAG: hypothetical protein A2033_12880 [Bacteroidetes bacterium GWA2_31_9]
MSAETRKQKREIRKLERNERKAAFAKLVEALKAVKDVNLKEGLTFKQKFTQVWPVVKPTLEFAIILKVTGEKFDTAAQKIIIMGNNMIGTEITDEQEIEFLAQLSTYWNIIETALEIVKIGVDDAKDEIIDKIIEVGEWLFEKS